jgi:CubicO group peptidase (beta-lactamase class C family)
VLLLAQDGRLSVRDKVSKYFPKLTRASEITLLDLMNHTSGYPDYYPLDFVDRRMQKSIGPDELIQQYAGGKLDFDPGTDWSYSNTGFIILARVVEKVSRQSFAHFLESRIFKPLGMTRTAYEPEAKDDRLATGYTSFALSLAKPVLPEATGWLGGAGGIYATPGDLVNWL